MNLDEVETRANEIGEHIEVLAKHYQNIVNKLSNIYEMISKTNSNQAAALKELIEKYNKHISELGNQYGQGANDLVSYVYATRENLDQLTANLKVTLKVYNDMLMSIEQ